MNLQQLRCVREAVRRGLNLTEAARALHTSQPGVSRSIRELERELGIEIFLRHGKRVTAVTEPGTQAIGVIERLLQEAENLKRLGRELSDRDTGTLRIATTHTQARYALPPVVARFRRRYPRVQLELHQGHPQELARRVAGGAADLAIATEALDSVPQLVALPAYTWRHCVVVPARHPLLRRRNPALEDLAKHPIVTYDPAFAGRSRIDEAFAARGLAPEVVFAAIDSDVIKAYVELGLGIGIIASMAFHPRRDRALRRLETGALFRSNTTRVALRRGALVRGYTFAFIEMFAPSLPRATVERSLKGGAEGYEL